MGDLRCADAEGVSAERAVRRGVAVAADDEEARQGQPLLRADHMDDALARVVEAEQRDPCAAAFADSSVDHAPDVAVRNAGGAGAGRHVVVGDAEGEVRAGDAGALRRELVEGVEGALVDEVAVDPEQGRAVLAGDDRMGVARACRTACPAFSPSLSSGAFLARSILRAPPLNLKLP